MVTRPRLWLKTTSEKGPHLSCVVFTNDELHNFLFSVFVCRFFLYILFFIFLIWVCGFGVLDFFVL